METTNNLKRSEIYLLILEVLDRLPVKSTGDDALDIFSAATEIEQLIEKNIIRWYSPTQLPEEDYILIKSKKGIVDMVRLDKFSKEEGRYIVGNYGGIPSSDDYRSWNTVEKWAYLPSLRGENYLVGNSYRILDEYVGEKIDPYISNSGKNSFKQIFYLYDNNLNLLSKEINITEYCRLNGFRINRVRGAIRGFYKKSKTDLLNKCIEYYKLKNN